MDRPRRAVILGSGRVATHLAEALSQILDIVQVWSRTPEHASKLAACVGASAISDINDVIRDADLYLISVSDDVVQTVSSALGDVAGIVAHTSGSKPLDVLQGNFKNRKCAVFYPLQTFSAERSLSLVGTPLLIEANTESTEQQLSALASEIGMTPVQADSALRARIHLAAVFACNFANMMWVQAEQLLAPDHLDLKFLAPLLQETLHKAIDNGAAQSMTGPAVRHDTGVLRQQEAALSGDRLELYRLVSKMIMKDYPNT